MNRKTFAPVLVLALSLTLVYCGKPMKSISNLDTTDAQAQAELDKRLEKTKEARKQLKRIIDAWAPVDSILVDLAKKLDTDVSLQGRKDNELLRLSTRLQEVLRESSKGIATIAPDGSWTIERGFNWPKRADLQCRTGRLKLAGERLEGADRMSLSLLDCGESEWVTLAEIDIESGGTLRTAFHLSSVEKSLQHDYLLGKCQLQIREGGSTVECTPFRIVSGEIAVLVDTLTVASSSRGVDASVKVRVNERDIERAVLTLEAHPGTRADLAVRVHGRN